MSSKSIGCIWGNGNYGWEVKNSIGRSGGLVCIWREGLFDVVHSFIVEGYVELCVNQNGRVVYMVNVYAPCNIEGKRRLWEDLLRQKNGRQSGDWCIRLAFNVVLSRRERRGVSQISTSTERNEFRQFIEAMELIEPTVLGKQYSWFC